jgi:hypothetical protein
MRIILAIFTELLTKTYNYESIYHHRANLRRHIMDNVRSLPAMEAQNEHLCQAG